jgi:hypothetical protein
VSKGQAPSRLAGRVNLNIAGPVEVGWPCGRLAQSAVWSAAWPSDREPGPTGDSSAKYVGHTLFPRGAPAVYASARRRPPEAPKRPILHRTQFWRDRRAATAEVGRRGPGGPVERTVGCGGAV